MNIQEISAPREIKDCLLTQGDVEINGYSEKGQNGYVFFGFHKIKKLRVVLKFYFYSDDAHKEVELLAKIDHPNIIKVWDAVTVGEGWAYFMTAEIEKGDLDKHIQERPIGLNEAIKITRGILDGVGMMHSPPYSILHRDLKPENILLDTKDIPIIADFGSVKRIPDGATYVAGSQHAPLYRPPESYDPGIYDYSSDIYQIGLVFYQLLGGYLPYNEEDWLNNNEKIKFESLYDNFEKSKFIEEVLYQKSRKAKLIDLSTLPPYVSDSLKKKIIRKAVNPDFTKRFKTTSEFLLALHKLGVIPDWSIIDGNITLMNWKGKDYRIVERKSTYIGEHKTCGSSKWRKNGHINPGNKEKVINSLIAALQSLKC